jgi:hypothetical protein
VQIAIALLLLAGLAVVGLCEWVAAVEYFKDDDFLFLTRTQSPDWSWHRAFFPIDTGQYWVVRPLGVDVFHHVGFAIFGAEPFGYFQVALLFRYATAIVVYRIARQLGFVPLVALATALVAITRPGGMQVLWWTTGFSYVGVTLFVCLSLSLFLDHLLHNRPWARAASIAFYVLALLHHENATLFPMVLFAAAIGAGGASHRRWAIGPALRSAAPHLLVLGVYLVLRLYVGARMMEDGRNLLDLSPGALLHSLMVVLSHLTPCRWATLLAALLIACVNVAIWRDRELRATALVALTSSVVLCLVWVLAAVLPSAIVRVPVLRYAMPAEIPAWIGLFAFVQLAWDAWGRQRPRFSATIIVACCVLLLPWSTLSARISSDEDKFPRWFVQTIERHHPELPDGVRFVVLYAGPEPSLRRHKRRFKGQTWGGTSLARTVWYDKMPTFAFHDLDELPPERILCDSCLYVVLAPDLRVRVPELAYLRQYVFEPALRAADRSIREAADRQLRRLGAAPTAAPEERLRLLEKRPRPPKES